MRFVLACVTALVVLVSQTSAQATKVSIFYESLCPDSIRFIRDQFTPGFKQLGPEYIDVDFVPYGKASHTQGPGGDWTFDCQHGPEECRGNKAQACALKHLQADAEQMPSFINCVMSANYPPDAGEKCAMQLNLDYATTQACIASTEADELLVAYGDRTHALGSDLTFVPTIVYDDSYDQTDQDQSLRNFLGVICSHLASPPANICG